MINEYSIYVLDQRGCMDKHYKLEDLIEIILVKADPSFLALSFREGVHPLILSSYRRAELMVYVLAQRQHAYPKPVVSIGDFVRLTFRTGRTFDIQFNKVLHKHSTNTIQQIYPEFVNAVLSGYLEKYKVSYFSGRQWERVFVVLSNIGLFCFAENAIDLPKDFYTLLNC